MAGKVRHTLTAERLTAPSRHHHQLLRQHFISAAVSPQPHRSLTNALVMFHEEQGRREGRGYCHRAGKPKLNQQCSLVAIARSNPLFCDVT